MQKARPIAGSQEELGSGKVMWIYALALTGTRHSPTLTACICRPRRTNRPNGGEFRTSRDLPQTFDEQPSTSPPNCLSRTVASARITNTRTLLGAFRLRISTCKKENPGLWRQRGRIEHVCLVCGPMLYRPLDGRIARCFRRGVDGPMAALSA